MPDAARWRALRRHAFVYIKRAAHAQIVSGIANPVSRGLVAAWLAQERPLIVPRQVPDFIAGTTPLAVGLALPPSGGKLRIALQAAPDAIERIAPPPGMRDVCPGVSARWRRVLEALAERGVEHGLAFRVFGSAAWQALTGMRYLTDQSDIDLLWRPADRARLDAGTALLQECNDALGTPLDGEILFGGDAAVSWREWTRRTAGETVLVKRLRGVSLGRRSDLLGLLNGDVAASTAQVLVA